MASAFTSPNQPVSSDQNVQRADARTGRANEDSKQDAKFVDDYRKLCADFDELVGDLFKGEELEKLTGDFLDRHRLYLAQFVLEFPSRVKDLLRGNVRNPTDLSRLNENLEDDLRLMGALECVARSKEDKEADARAPKRELNAILADLYRRTGQACYLRVTFNKSRFDREEDRREPLAWLQLAIRHDWSNFQTCYWYMITVGRYSDALSNPRDQTLAGEAFKRATLRCLEMDPADPLAHHLLGRYYFHVGSLNWIQRTLVKSFFNFKVEGTLEDAEREFRAAHALKDDWLPTGLWMARVLLAQNKAKQEIKSWIEWALKMEAREPTTEVERAELLELGRKLKVIP